MPRCCAALSTYSDTYDLVVSHCCAVLSTTPSLTPSSSDVVVPMPNVCTVRAVSVPTGKEAEKLRKFSDLYRRRVNGLNHKFLFLVRGCIVQRFIIVVSCFVLCANSKGGCIDYLAGVAVCVHFIPSRHRYYSRRLTFKFCFVSQDNTPHTLSFLLLLAKKALLLLQLQQKTKKLCVPHTQPSPVQCSATPRAAPKFLLIDFSHRPTYHCGARRMCHQPY